MRYSVLIGLIFCSTARGQQAGTVESYRQQVRSQRAAQKSELADEFAKEDKLFASTHSLESFYQAVAADRRYRLADLYSRRENASLGKGTRAAVPKLNKQIEELNDPRKPFLADVSCAAVITVAVDPQIRQIVILDVVDPKNAIAECREAAVGRRGFVFWLADSETSGWSDGNRVDLPGVLISQGTKTYQTEGGGSTTVPMMRRFDVDPQRLTRKDEVREWKPRAGESRSGALVNCENGHITLMDLGGKKSAIRLADLTDEDRQIVEQLAPIHNSAAKPR